MKQLTLPKDAEISFLPPTNKLTDLIDRKPEINPTELYKNAGIQTNSINGMNIPIDFESLKKGIQQKYNFGDQNLANLYKSPLYEPESFLKGLYQGRNYGSPALNTAQKSFLPSTKSQAPIYAQPQAEMPINNTAEQNVSTQEPLNQTVEKKGFDFSKIGSFLNHPVTRGAIMAGVVGLTGGSGLQALAYGANTGTKYAANQQENKFNRELLKQSGVDLNNLPNGFLTDEMLKNYITLEDAKTSKIYKDSIINYYKDRYKLNIPKDGPKKIQELADIYYSAGTLDPENYHNIMEYAKRYPDRTISSKDFEKILSEIPTTLEKQKILTEKAKEKKYLHDSNKPYPNHNDNHKSEDNLDYKDALAQFSDIYNSGHNGKTEYARKQFIKHFGIDPYKKLAGGKS